MRKGKPTTPIANCRDEVSLIAAYLTDSLSAPKRQAFESHLNACRDCAAFLATYKKTIELTRSFLRDRSANRLQPRL